MKKNVLIINHDQREADEIKGRLLSSVSEVICATSMQDAMKYFIKIEFALIILDAHIETDDSFLFLIQLFFELFDECINFFVELLIG